jgi:hypothetical protein
VSLLRQRPLAFTKLVTTAAVSPAVLARIARQTQRRLARSQPHLTCQLLWLALPGQCRGDRQDPSCTSLASSSSSDLQANAEKTGKIPATPQLPAALAQDPSHTSLASSSGSHHQICLLAYSSLYLANRQHICYRWLSMSIDIPKKVFICFLIIPFHFLLFGIMPWYGLLTLNNCHFLFPVLLISLSYNQYISLHSSMFY